MSGIAASTTRRATANSYRAARSARTSELPAASKPCRPSLGSGQATKGAVVTVATAGQTPVTSMVQSRQVTATTSGRGQRSELFLELESRASPLKPSHAIVLAKPSKQKATRTDNARPARRGELDGIQAKYAGINDYDELVRLCSALRNGQIKTRELEELYRRGKIGVAPTRVKEFVYGRVHHNDKSKWSIHPNAYLALSKEDIMLPSVPDELMLLGQEAEDVMAHTVVRLHRRKKGLTENEIKMWARAQVRCALAQCVSLSISQQV